MEECIGPECFDSIGGWSAGDLVDFIVGLALFFILYNLIFGNFIEKRTKKRLNKDNLNSQKNNNKTTSQDISEVEELQKKIENLNEEEKLKDLRDQLNQKRIDRGLLPLLEFENLENKIKDLQNINERKKRSRKHTQDKSSYLKPRRNTGSAILFIASAYSFYSTINSGIPALISGIIFWIIGVSFFYYINKKIKFFKNKSNTLSAEIKDLEIEIEKNLEILNQNKL
jgi:hypothetical protein